MTQPTSFVPADLDCGSWPAVEPLYRALLHRTLSNASDVRRWLRDFSELTDSVGEFGVLAQIRNTCHTDDPDAERAFMHFVQEIDAKVKPLYSKLQRKFVDAVAATGLRDDPFIAHLTRRWQADIDVYCEANIPLQIQDTELTTRYDKVCGAMTVEFRGTPHTLQALAKYLDDPDASVREEAWRLMVGRRLRDREQLDDIFDALVGLRDTIAHNAGHPDYRSYTWLVKKRFDYTPDMCAQFADACEALVVPLVEDLDAQAAHDLGVSALRPWDTAVDPKRRPPLRPFAPDDMEGFVEKAHRMFSRLSPHFGAQFATLTLGDTLDLDSRPGKRPGGYQEWLPKRRVPFIFMNAVGSDSDVKTLLHEGGHAFHAIESSARLDVTFALDVPAEFAEVASMSMELLPRDFYDEFYSTEDATRASRQALERAVRILPWIATIDTFQHWIYTHASHTREERTSTWLALLDRFSSRRVDWTGLEQARAAGWQRQIHLFDFPFYYIEYGIAQLGALQLWLQYRRDPARALEHYRRALSLGGSRPLPELFDAAGLRFDFSASTIAPLVTAVREELEALPA